MCSLGERVFQGGYHPGKMKHISRVAFQDQGMYAHTLFMGVQKHPKLEKKCVFGDGHKFCGKNDRK